MAVEVGSAKNIIPTLNDNPVTLKSDKKKKPTIGNITNLKTDENMESDK